MSLQRLYDAYCCPQDALCAFDEVPAIVKAGNAGRSNVNAGIYRYGRIGPGEAYIRGGAAVSPKEGLCAWMDGRSAFVHPCVHHSRDVLFRHRYPTRKSGNGLQKLN